MASSEGPESVVQQFRPGREGSGSSAEGAAADRAPSPSVVNTSAPPLVRVVDFDNNDVSLGELGPDLIRILALTARISRQAEDEADLSFSSMLITLVASPDPVSNWFRTYLSNTDVSLPGLLSTRKLASEAELRAFLDPAVEPHELADPFVASSSARRLFAAALDLAGIVSGGQPLGVRHLIGAYIYDGAGHDEDFRRLRFNRPDWSVAFVSFMTRHRPEEGEGWAAQHRRVFPDVALGPLDDAGPSTHIASDLWTTTDALGYSAYALALARFIRHPKTQAPLAIGIQAPWGGGKTSLMRMVRDELSHADRPASTAEPVSVPGIRPRAAGGGLSVADVLAEAASQSADTAAHPLEPGTVVPLSVWFNAWKYESTNQVWAGLADAILHQVADQLPPAERERFWLRLNFRRIEPDRVRTMIHERLFRLWWQWSRWLVYTLAWLVGILVMAAAGGAVANVAWLRTGGLVAAPGSAVAGALWLGGRWLETRRQLLKEPAKLALPDLVSIPPYEQELGFVHQVEVDVQRVLWALDQTQGDRPLVVFIDDLDRCSPTKVAQVVEAVNLFLAGSMPRCVFVVGIDAEMVAAALQAAHEQLTAHLPTEAGTPLGWRFMDKFIQLPFVIPPVTNRDLLRYADSLLGADLTTTDSGLDDDARAALAGIHDRSQIGERINQVRQSRQGQSLDPAQEARYRRLLEARVERHEIEAGIKRFDDATTEIRDQVRRAAVEFSHNPRELKRFVNAYRFQYFLSWAAIARTGRPVSLDQLRRWVVFSLRWPQVVRWCWRVPGQQPRLQLLEDAAGRFVTFDDWLALAPERLRLPLEQAPWLADPALHAFFQAEAELDPDQRLTAGIGRGLW